MVFYVLSLGTVDQLDTLGKALGVHRSWANQSKCNLRTWKSRLTVSLGGVLWGVLREYGESPNMGYSVPITQMSEFGLVRIAGRKLDLFQ